MGLTWGLFHTLATSARSCAGPPRPLQQLTGGRGQAGTGRGAGFRRARGRSCLVLPGKPLLALLLRVSTGKHPLPLTKNPLGAP